MDESVSGKVNAMKVTISNLQMFIIAANTIMAATIFNFPTRLSQISGQHSWIAIMASTAVLFPFLWLWIVIYRKNPINLWELVIQKRWVGQGFLLFFIPFALLILIRDLRAYVDFIVTVLLPHTPKIVIVMMSALTMAYIAKAGIEVIARFTQIFFFIVAPIIFLLPLLLLNELELMNFQPALNLQSLLNIAHGGALSFGWVGEIIFICFLFPLCLSEKKIRKTSFLALGIGIFSLSLIVALMTATLGKDIVANSVFPTLTLVREIHLTDFLDRLDVLLISLFMTTLFAKMAFVLYVLKKAICHLVKKTDMNAFITPLALVIGMLSILMFDNQVEDLDFSNYAWPYIGAFFEVVLLMWYWLLYRKKT